MSLNSEATSKTGLASVDTDLSRLRLIFRGAAVLAAKQNEIQTGWQQGMQRYLLQKWLQFIHDLQMGTCAQVKKNNGCTIGPPPSAEGFPGQQSLTSGSRCACSCRDLALLADLRHLLQEPDSHLS